MVQMKGKILYAVALLWLGLVVYGGFRHLSPHSETAPFRRYGVEMDSILQHVRVISQKAHYVGADAHAEVKAYITRQIQKLGYQVHVHTDYERAHRASDMTHVQNIWTELQGSGGQKSALLLLSHYDAAPTSSKGASDDAVGVAILLELLRILKANGIGHQNDIVVLLTDAEEIGLIGAKAFVRSMPVQKHIGCVLNFEARGSGGPSFMLIETNGGNAGMVRAFDASQPSFPTASSLMYSIYKMLPNDTDLSVFREDGDINGFNFAFIDDHFDYHTALDNFARIDTSSVIHQMDYLLSLFDYLKDASLDALYSSDDRVYLGSPLWGVMHYPYEWVVWMWVLAVVLWLVLGWRWRATYGIQITRVILSFVVIVGLLVGLYIAFVLLWKILSGYHPQYRDILQGFPYNGHAYIWFSVWSSLGLMTAVRAFCKKCADEEFVLAALAIWLIINGFIALYLKGAGYFVLPVLFAMLVYLLTTCMVPDRVYWPIIWALAAAPMLYVLFPYAREFVVALGMEKWFLAPWLTALTFAIALPVLGSARLWYWSVAFFIVAAWFFIRAQSNSSWDSAERPQPVGLCYAYDVPSQRAWWATYNHFIPPWLKSVMGDSLRAGSPDEIALFNKYRDSFTYHSEAPSMELRPSKMDWAVDDTSYADKLRCRLRIAVDASTNNLVLKERGVGQYYYLRVDTHRLGDADAAQPLENVVRHGELMHLWGAHRLDTLEVEWVMDREGVVGFEVYELRYGLRKNLGESVPMMPAHIIPMPFVVNDAVMIRHVFELR